MNRPPLFRASRGFTLVELLIVVAIIAIIAAIAIPNLLTAVQRGRQKRTMGDLKTLATALENTNNDNSAYPVSSFGPVVAGAGIYDPDTGIGIGANLATVILGDGWYSSDNPTAKFRYGSDATGQNNYVLCSMGKNTTAAADGALGCADATRTNTTAANVDGTTFNCDISVRNGQFIQAPLGKQNNNTGC